MRTDEFRTIIESGKKIEPAQQKFESMSISSFIGKYTHIHTQTIYFQKYRHSKLFKKIISLYRFTVIYRDVLPWLWKKRWKATGFFLWDDDISITYARGTKGNSKKAVAKVGVKPLAFISPYLISTPNRHMSMSKILGFGMFCTTEMLHHSYFCNLYWIILDSYPGFQIANLLLYKYKLQ